MYLVYSVDPAQLFPISNFSYVRPSLTVFPYAVANHLPFHMAASFLMDPDATSDPAAENAKNFFFTHSTGVDLAGETGPACLGTQTLSAAAEALIRFVRGSVPAPTLTWPDADYDTIWTVRLDSKGNLTLDNALCEGIDSGRLPVMAPQF
jgi:hypothetical protein